jgi:hypothetical protein
LEFHFEPAPLDLSPWVIGFGERRDETSLSELIELPIPSAALHFMMGGDYFVATESAAPRSALWGPVVEPAAAFTDAPAQVFLVFLTAHGAVALARAPLSALMGRRIEYEALGRSGNDDLADRLSRAADFAERASIARAWLRCRFEPSGHSAAPVLVLCDAIVAGEFTGSVQNAAAAIGLTARGLNKAFWREIGCSPKRLLRIARLKRVLQAVHPRPWAGRPDVDPFLEYHDQAHLDRDFADLTGVSRRGYILNKTITEDRLLFTIHKTSSGASGADIKNAKASIRAPRCDGSRSRTAQRYTL